MMCSVKVVDCRAAPPIPPATNDDEKENGGEGGDPNTSDEDVTSTSV